MNTTTETNTNGNKNGNHRNPKVKGPCPTTEEGVIKRALGLKAAPTKPLSKTEHKEVSGLAFELATLQRRKDPMLAQKIYYIGRKHSLAVA